MIHSIQVKVELILIELLYDMSNFFGKRWFINQKTPTTKRKGDKGEPTTSSPIVNNHHANKNSGQGNHHHNWPMNLAKHN